MTIFREGQFFVWKEEPKGCIYRIDKFLKVGSGGVLCEKWVNFTKQNLFSPFDSAHFGNGNVVLIAKSNLDEIT